MNTAADAYCAAMLKHYENFTVASRLAPRALRRDLARVYAFARTTDDLGDESGDPAVATHRLIAWRAEVTALFAGEVALHPVLAALRDTIERHALPSQPFMDLIDANLQDQRVATYEDWPALLGYCRLSAAPVGRLVLHLFGVTDPRSFPLSDDVCIGLQLANFAQDVSVDARRGRTYLMQCDLRELGEAGAVRAMCVRARTLLASGRELEATLSGRLRLQLALYRLGGEAILDAVARTHYATAYTRPTVGRVSRARVALQALLKVAGVKPGPVTAGTPPRPRFGLPTASAPSSPRSRGAPPTARPGLPPAAPPGFTQQDSIAVGDPELRGVPAVTGPRFTPQPSSIAANSDG